MHVTDGLERAEMMPRLFVCEFVHHCRRVFSFAGSDLRDEGVGAVGIGGGHLAQSRTIGSECVQAQIRILVLQFDFDRTAFGEIRQLTPFCRIGHFRVGKRHIGIEHIGDMQHQNAARSGEVAFVHCRSGNGAEFRDIRNGKRAGFEATAFARRDAGCARRVHDKVAVLCIDEHLARIRSRTGVLHFRNFLLVRDGPCLGAVDCRGASVIGDPRADSRYVAELGEGVWEQAASPHIAEPGSECFTGGYAVAVNILGGSDISASKQENDLPFGHLSDRVANDIEAADEVIAEKSLASVAPCEAVDGVPVLQGAVCTHGETAFRAETVGRAEVVFRYGERPSENAGRRLHHRFVVGGISRTDTGGLVDVERKFLVARLRVVSVAVVVHEFQRFAFVGLGCVIPPVAAGNQRFHACVLKPLGHPAVCLCLDRIQEFGEFFLFADILFRVFGIALCLGPFVVFFDVQICRAPPNRCDGIFVYERDEEDGRIILPFDAGVGVDVVENFHCPSEPLIFGGFVDWNDRLDGIRIQGLVESFAASETAHGIQVECHVDACLFEFGHQIVKLIETCGGDFRVGRTLPQFVPFILGDSHVDMVESNRIPTAADEILNNAFAFFLAEEVCGEAEISANEADWAIRAIFENDMSFFADLCETELSGRRLPLRDIGEIENRSRRDVIAKREFAPVFAGGQFRGGRRKLEIHLALAFFQGVCKCSGDRKFDGRGFGGFRIGEFEPQFIAFLLVFASVLDDRVSGFDVQLEFDGFIGRDNRQPAVSVESDPFLFVFGRERD